MGQHSDDRAASEKFIDGEWKQQMWNPLDGGWEWLSHRQWRLLKLRIPKARHAEFDDWKLAIFEGPESACAYAFGLDKTVHRATVAWLATEYSKFNISSPAKLYSWSQWILDLYPLDRMHSMFNKAAAIADRAAEMKRLQQCLLTSLMAEHESTGSKSRKSRRRH